MDTGNQILLLALVVTLVGTVIARLYRSRVTEPQRSEALEEVVRQNGWMLTPVFGKERFYEYHFFPFFKNSKVKETLNGISGQIDGVPFVACDYRYFKKVFGAYRRTSQIETLIIVELIDSNLPEFALTQPSVLEPAINHYHTIDSAGLYRLEGIDDDAVLEVITPELALDAPDFNVQGQANHILFYRTWKRSSVEMIVSDIKQCVDFAKRLGGYVSSPRVDKQRFVV